jgi:phosphoglycolate/pyridoxal phosphate phosphatase family enzyme
MVHTALRLVVFDLDGVVYRGSAAVPGAAGLIDALHRAGCAVRYATNNSMYTRAQFVARLAGLGIVATRDEVVTSVTATIGLLHTHMSDVHRVLAVGEAGMLTELKGARFEVTPAIKAAEQGWNGGPLPVRYDAVVAGLDQQIDYRRLAIAATAIREGAHFVATNADLRFATPQGVLPGAGTIIAALAATTGVEPIVVGKPQPAMFEAILEAAGVRPADALVIGDNPDSDIVAARRSGIPSVLILTGVTDAAAARALDGERRPDRVVTDMADLAAVLGLSVR